MKILLLFYVFCLFGTTLRADQLSLDTELAINPDLPEKYKYHVIIPNSLSPNHRYAFLYPEYCDIIEGTCPKALLVQLKPFKVLQELSISSWLYGGWPCYQVIWNKDSTLALFIPGLKWGPENIILCGKSVNVDLFSEIREIVNPIYLKYKATHDGVLPGPLFLDSAWDDVPSTYFIKGNRAEISIYCSDDPKHLAGDDWEVRFNGTWDSSEGKFIDYSIHRTPKADLN